jgi:D-alanyl-D-alanine carboxypeptidase
MPRDITRRDLLVGGGLGLAGTALAACGSNVIAPVTRTTGPAPSLAGPITEASTPGSTAPGTTAPAADPRAVKLDAATTAKLDQLLADGVKASGIAGIDIAVWIGDQEWRRQSGLGDLTFKIPYPADNAARIASITKTFTATGVLQQVDQKQLSLDDKLDTYVTGIANGNQVTIRNLLNMTSGIYDFTSDKDFVARFDADPTMPWSDDDTLAIIRAHPADFAPGAKVVYCDSNYALLGMILPKVTNQPLATAITTQIVDKVGLSATTFPTSETMPTPHPTAYLPDVPADATSPYPFDNTARPPKAVNEVNPAVAGGAGAMTSTVLDLKKWAKELTDGTLLSPETQRERIATQPMDGQRLLRYGMGIMSIGEIMGHTGAIIGYNSVALRLPSADATFVAVSNESTNFTTPSTDLIMVPIMQYLYPGQFR